MARSEVGAFLAQAETQHGLGESALESAYVRVSEIVEAQRHALAKAMPDIGDGGLLIPVEMWFVWGLAHELMANAASAQMLFVWYLHQRRRLPIERARDWPRQMLDDSQEDNCLFDSMAVAGRLAAHDGEDGYFIKAATAFRQDFAAA